MAARRRGGARRGVFGAAALAGSYLAVRSGRARRLDDAVARAAHRALGPAADRIISSATDLGSVYGILGLSGVLAAAGRRQAATDVAAAGFLAWGAAQATKPLLPRDRPYQATDTPRLVAVPAGTSWPSGHAAVVAAMASILAPRVGPAARVGLGAAAAGVGASRLYVGVHHATDLVAGCGVGLLASAAWSRVRR